jgi:hypothetical protein
MLSIIENYEIPLTQEEIQAALLYKQGVDFGLQKGMAKGLGRRATLGKMGIGRQTQRHGNG